MGRGEFHSSRGPDLMDTIYQISHPSEGGRKIVRVKGGQISRGDVLCVTFGLICWILYTEYVIRKRRGGDRESTRRADYPG